MLTFTHLFLKIQIFKFKHNFYGYLFHTLALLL